MMRLCLVLTLFFVPFWVEAENAPAAIVTSTSQSESEIPLNLEKALKSAESTTGGSFRLYGALIAVFFLAGAGVYWMSRRTTRSNPMGMQIKLMTQFHLGPKRSLAIVRVAGESILIGITEHNISLIKALSLLDEEIPEDTPRSFEGAISKANSSPEEEFSVGEIRDVVEKKMRAMRDI